MEFREKPHTEKYKGITNDSNYVEYFDGLIFVAQGVQSNYKWCQLLHNFVA
jgi:hypothetical protein